ncbi:sensor histidine kinase [Terrihabitans soli]|uniref:histidine kinase n=1 Tax=Terrihabitans soli TaxID=708113 RepID=A0A6S6QS34_9HYPH|nr:ATP-binding protein [Terrihabitans soli]BCJ90525.1 sensor histidine kinase [Terrihabitans soli]
MKRRQVFVRSTVALVAIGMLVLLGVVGTTIWLAAQSSRHFEAFSKARDVRIAAAELRSAMQSAETAQRGFIITGNQIYLAPYGTAKNRAGRQMTALNGLLSIKGEVPVSVQRLTVLVREKFEELDSVIQLKRERRDDEAVAVVRTNRGKALMDEANVFISGIILDTDEKLTRDAEQQRANIYWLRTISIAGAVVIVLVLGAAAFVAIRYTRDLQRARDEVTALNATLERRVEARTADLARANDEIRRFAHVVSHDLRAPLVNIMGFTSELEAGVRELQPLSDTSGSPSEPVLAQARIAVSEMPEAIKFIRSSSSKMDQLLSAILKLSREGRRALTAEKIDLAELAGMTAAAIRHQIDEAQGTISLALDVPAITSDRLSLEQVFGNLLDNAVKYRAKDRPLRIAIRAKLVPGDRVEIEIEDNGRGIAEQDHERVFELFRRSGMQDAPGEGVGLAHVRNVIRNLGGEIALRSILNQGTTFVITLPRQLGEGASA